MNPPATRRPGRIRFDSVFQASLIVFTLLLATKLLNFLKKILIGQLFGVSRTADAFFAASFLPYYLAIFFEGVLFLGFLPLYAQLKAEKGEEAARQFVLEILLLILVVTTGMVALAWWGTPWIVRELVPGFRPETRGLTQSLFQILSIVLLFITLTSFFKALNSYFEHYAVAASSGFVDTVVMIAITLLSWKLWGIYGAAWGSVAGVLAAFLVQAVFLFKKQEIFPARWVFRSAWLGKLALFLPPMAVIWVFQQTPTVILNRFGSGMWEGTISALAIAHTLTIVPMGLVSHTVLFAVFPSLARQTHETTPENLRETFFQTLRGGFLILIPAGFLLTALAPPLAGLFFDGGGIAEEGTQRIADSLACFGWATFVLYADHFMTQSLIAARRPLPAILLTASRAVLTYVIGYFFSALWDYQGLAFSFSLALAVNFFLLFPPLFKLSPYVGGWTALFRYTAKLLAASAPILLMGGFLSRRPIGEWMEFSEAPLIFFLGLAFAGGASLYVLLLYLLGVREIRPVFQELKSRWGRKDWWLAEPTE